MACRRLVSLAWVLSLASTVVGCMEGGEGNMSLAVEMPNAGRGAGAGVDTGAGSGAPIGASIDGGAEGSMGGAAGVAAGAGGDAQDAGGVGAASAGGTGGVGAAGSGSAGATGGAGDAGDNGALACAGDAPHGCYVAQSGNHPMCPPTTPEQSAYYPPLEEWNGCNGIMPAAPFGGDPAASCSYRGPAGEIATCLCDTGLHWLCTYPM